MMIEFFEVRHLWALLAILGTFRRSGHFLTFLALWALLGTFGYSGHFWATWSLLGTLGTFWHSGQKCPECPIVPRMPKSAKKCPECPKVPKLSKVHKNAQSAKKCLDCPKVPKSAQSAQKFPKVPRVPESAQKCPEHPKVSKIAKSAQSCRTSKNSIIKFFLGHPVCLFFVFSSFGFRSPCAYTFDSQLLSQSFHIFFLLIIFLSFFLWSLRLHPLYTYESAYF